MKVLSLMNVVSRLQVAGLVAWVLFLGLAQIQPAFAQATAPAARTVAPKPDAQTAPSPRQARERSPAQKANDERMRACGAEWRAKKAELSARGETWRKFSVECRARLKAKGA